MIDKLMFIDKSRKKCDSSNTSKICSKCGAELLPDATFCIKCRKEIMQEEFLYKKAFLSKKNRELNNPSPKLEKIYCYLSLCLIFIFIVWGTGAALNEIFNRSYNLFQWIIILFIYIRL